MAELVLRALGALFAGYGAAYLLIAIASPRIFLDWLAVNAAERRGSKQWQIWIRIALTVLGLGLFFYFAAYSMSRGIPYDWGNFNEDGEWEYARHAFQLTFAGYGTLMTLTTLEERAEAVVNKDIIVAKLQALEYAIKFYGDQKTKQCAEERKREKIVELRDQSNSEHVQAICTSELEQIDWALKSGVKE